MYSNVVQQEAAGQPEKAGPEYGVGVYRDITEWASGTPEWMQKLGEIFTEGGILVFARLPFSRFLR